MLAALTWGHFWKGGQVIVHCDNIAVVAAINKRSSKDEAIMHMLRSLFFIEAHHQFHTTAVHIAGSLNNLADNLSRNQIDLFFKAHKTASAPPSFVDPCLL